MRRVSLLSLVLFALSCTEAPRKASPRHASSDRGGLAGEIEHIVTETLSSTSVPSFSVAVVNDGKLVFAEAFGHARLEPKTKAEASMHYPIGSVSKQFTAAALLLLADEGELSLDDDISPFFPEVTRAKEIKVRDLLAHTAGLQDYWPQWYIPLFMAEASAPTEIVRRWGAKPLDFDPVTKWQYSNTGYVAAGLIVEQVAGKPLFEFMQEQIFQPLSMDVLNYDGTPLGDQDPIGYTRTALAPPRPGAIEKQGWKFAAGNLAMSAEDLAKWNIAVIERRLLSAAAYREFTAAVRLSNGVGTNYGLGLHVEMEFDRRKLAHGGMVGGFAAYNAIFPDDSAAVTVLTNEANEGYGAGENIANRIVPLLFQTGDETSEARAKTVFEGLQRGRIDPALFTQNARAYFSEVVLSDHATSLRPLGAVEKVVLQGERKRGGFIQRRYSIECERGAVGVAELDSPTGGLEQFAVYAE